MVRWYVRRRWASFGSWFPWFFWLLIGFFLEWGVRVVWLCAEKELSVGWCKCGLT